MSYSTKNVCAVVLLLGVAAAACATTTDEDVESSGAALGDAARTVTAAADTVPANGNFQLANGRIYDPSGKLFVPMGFNAWPDASGSAAFYKDCWRANVVRLNHVKLKWDGWYSKAAMKKTIDELTKRGVVAMIEWHEVGQIGDAPNAWNHNGSIDFGSSKGHMDAIAAFHVEFAKQYVDNPYVWFNIINEPGGDPKAGEMDRWVNVSKHVIQAIRATGNKNIVIADGMTWGQDAGGKCAPVTEQDSAILARGKDLAALGNVAFNIHLYDRWKCDLGKRLPGFLDSAAAKGLSVFVGEYNDPALIKPASDILQQRRIGRLFWHVSAGDSPITTDGKGPSSCTAPTNLNALGRAVWDDMHR